MKQKRAVKNSSDDCRRRFEEWLNNPSRDNATWAMMAMRDHMELVDGLVGRNYFWTKELRNAKYV